MLSKTYTNDVSGTPSSCYQYDKSSVSGASGYLMGRLTNSWTQAGACAGSSGETGAFARRSILSHDAMSRVLSEPQCTSSTCGSTLSYTPSYIYDRAGNVATWFDGFTNTSFTNSFDTANRLPSVTTPTMVHIGSGISASGATTGLFSAQSYSAAGGLTGALFGSGLQLNRIYDSRLRISSETDMGNMVPSPTAESTTLTITGVEQKH